jgi:hypothetical protein
MDVQEPQENIENNTPQEVQNIIDTIQQIIEKVEHEKYISNMKNDDDETKNVKDDDETTEEENDDNDDDNTESEDDDNDDDNTESEDDDNDDETTENESETSTVINNDDVGEEEKDKYVFMIIDNSKFAGIFEKKEDALKFVLEQKELYIVQNLAENLFREETVDNSEEDNTTYYRIYSKRRYYLFLYMEHLEREYQIIQMKLQ